MLKWEPGLESLHRSRMRVVEHKSLVPFLQRFGGLEVLDYLEVLVLKYVTSFSRTGWLTRWVWSF